MIIKRVLRMLKLEHIPLIFAYMVLAPWIWYWCYRGGLKGWQLIHDTSLMGGFEADMFGLLLWVGSILIGMATPIWLWVYLHPEQHTTAGQSK